jgi:hypothetical protein
MSRSRRRNPSTLATTLARQGYQFRFATEGEALVFKPDGVVYTVSLSGAVFPEGCSCPAGKHALRCKHRIIVENFRPCDAPGCGGVQQYHNTQTIGGPVPVFERLSCHKTTDPQLVQLARSPRNSENLRSVA